MATATSWPALLPLPTFQGYGIEPLDSVLRTDMEQGAARQRQVYTKVPERISVRWRFSLWEYALFRSWYRYKAKAGAEWFTITLLTGLGMAGHEVRFAGQGKAPYRAVPNRGQYWIVTSVLEVRESPDLSEAALDIALAEDIPGLLAAIQSGQVLVNTTLPTDSW